MPVTGSIPLSGMQGAIEATAGTILPSTRKVPILGGWLNEISERKRVVEQRVSFIRNYRSHQINRHVEISGLQIQPTYEDLAWWFQFFLKGGVTGVSDAGTPPAYTYTFTPSATTQDLKTGNFEFLTDTQDFSVPYCVGNRLQLGFEAGGDMTMSLDFLGQRANKQSRTAALTDRVVEDVIGADGTTYIDPAAGTIGTTLAAYPLSMNLTLDNHWNQLWTLGGTRYPAEAYRGEQRSIALEMQVAFASITEWDAFITSPQTRKLRYVVQGSQIHGATVTNKSLTIDWYGTWDEGSFGEQNGLRTVTLRGESEFDTTLSADWQIKVVNALVTLP